MKKKQRFVDYTRYSPHKSISYLTGAKIFQYEALSSSRYFKGKTISYSLIKNVEHDDENCLIYFRFFCNLFSFTSLHNGLVLLKDWLQ